MLHNIFKLAVFLVCLALLPVSAMAGDPYGADDDLLRKYRINVGIHGKGRISIKEISPFSGASLQLVANEDKGWTFKRWSGDVDSPLRSITLGKGPHKVVAVFSSKSEIVQIKSSFRSQMLSNIKTIGFTNREPEILWQFDINTYENSKDSIINSTPAVDNEGNLFLGGMNGKLYKMQGCYPHDKRVDPVWVFDSDGSIYSSPAIDENSTIYFGSVSKCIYAVNGFTGLIIWKLKVGDTVLSSPTLSRTPLTINGKEIRLLYIGIGHALGDKATIPCEDNRVLAINTVTGDIIWEFKTLSCIFSSPVLDSKGTVYIGSQDKNLYALDGRTGEKKWSFETGSGVNGSATVSPDGSLVFGSCDGKIYCLDSVSGSIKWSVDTGYVVFSSPVIFNNKVYIGGHSGKIYSLNLADGKIAWEFDSGKKVEASPAISSDGVVYVGNLRGDLFALDASEGSLIWKISTQGDKYNGFFSSPVIGPNGVVYDGSDNGIFYAIGYNKEEGK